MIETDMETSAIEGIDKIGKVLLTNTTYEIISTKLKRKQKILDRQIFFWNQRLKSDNTAYYEIINKFTNDPQKTLETIKKDAENILEIIRKLDQGIGFDDAQLVANAKWIRQNTGFEPFVITDDRDLLACGHAISSFFGIIIGFFSCFELFRLLELDGPLRDYCNHYGLEENMNGLSYNWSKLELETEISKLLTKGKIACHPCPRGQGTNPLKKIKR